MIYRHGGDIGAVARQFAIPGDRILDFSANINPAGLPRRAAERLARDAANPGLLAEYPDPQAHELRRILSKRLQVPLESIVIGAGAGSLILAAIRALQPRRCLIPVPAFCEYERSCRACGCEMIPLALRPERNFQFDATAFATAGRHDLLILNNPHNPTGALASRPEMITLIEQAGQRGVRVIVDEAFIDYAPPASITDEASTLPGVIAIRSLTKFYGCPALRVGYGIGEPDMARRISDQIPAWPVTTLALNALAEAVLDTRYARKTLLCNETGRNQLAKSLRDLECNVYPGAANFLLVRLPAGVDALQVRGRLIVDHAILVRECDSFQGLEPGRYLRIAVRTSTENQRLVGSLQQVFQELLCHRNPF